MDGHSLQSDRLFLKGSAISELFPVSTNTSFPDLRLRRNSGSRFPSFTSRKKNHPLSTWFYCLLHIHNVSVSFEHLLYSSTCPQGVGGSKKKRRSAYFNEQMLYASMVDWYSCIPRDTKRKSIALSCKHKKNPSIV